MELGGSHSFWNTLRGFQSPSNFDNLLGREDITLQELLKEEEIVNETMNNNEKLIRFLNKEKLLELISYFTEIEDSSDNARLYKYPFVSCDIICTGNISICNLILDDKELMDKIFAVLEYE